MKCARRFGSAVPLLQFHKCSLVGRSSSRTSLRIPRRKGLLVAVFELGDVDQVTVSQPS